MRNRCFAILLSLEVAPVDAIANSLAITLRSVAVTGCPARMAVAIGSGSVAAREGRLTLCVSLLSSPGFHFRRLEQMCFQVRPQPPPENLLSFGPQVYDT